MKARTAAALFLLCAGLAFAALGCGAAEDVTTTTSTTAIPTTTTTTEAPATWREAQPVGDTPSARCYQGMVYDSESDQILVFGGFDGVESLGDTWVYDPATERWGDLEAQGEGQPLADKQIAAAYAAAEQLVVSFDGTTWGYDVVQNSWSALGPKGAKLKPARQGCCMAVDQRSGVVVLFGGTDNLRSYNETWVYDPSTNWWGRVEIEGDIPKGRSDASMVYDPGTGLMVLFGGVDSDFTCLNDMWTFDIETSTWTRVVANTRVPMARSAHAMAYDGHSGEVILFGGIDSQFVCYNDTWAYDVAENSWKELMPTGANPQPRCRMQLVYASAVDKLVLFGGMTFGVDVPGGLGIPSYFGDTWVFGVEP